MYARITTTTIIHALILTHLVQMQRAAVYGRIDSAMVAPAFRIDSVAVETTCGTASATFTSASSRGSCHDRRVGHALAVLTPKLQEVRRAVVHAVDALDHDLPLSPCVRRRFV